MTIALAENAIANGVSLFLQEKVVSIEPPQESTNELFMVQTVHNTNSARYIKSRVVVNCAGLFADEIAGLIGDATFKIGARKGEYLLLSREQGDSVNSVLFQTPTEMVSEPARFWFKFLSQWGKGILVSPTYSGNLLLGPSAIPSESKEDTDTSLEVLGVVAWSARKTLPHFDSNYAMTSYAGLRARSNRRDFIIEESPSAASFFNVAGIESPGLTASPAIALRVIEMIKTRCTLVEKGPDQFNPIRRHPSRTSSIEPNDIIVCKCESVRRSTIENALQSGIKLTCTDSVKWR